MKDGRSFTHGHINERHKSLGCKTKFRKYEFKFNFIAYNL